MDARYREALSNVTGLQLLDRSNDVEPNFSYFPILVAESNALTRDGVYEALRTKGIFARRYFYPLLSNLPMYTGIASAAADGLPVANRAANQILCLPIYHDLAAVDQDRVIGALQGKN